MDCAGAGDIFSLRGITGIFRLPSESAAILSAVTVDLELTDEAVGNQL